MPVPAFLTKHTVGYGITGASGITGTTVASVKCASVSTTQNDSQHSEMISLLAQGLQGATLYLGNGHKNVTKSGGGSNVKAHAKELLELRYVSGQIMSDPGNIGFKNDLSVALNKLQPLLGDTLKSEPKWKEELGVDEATFKKFQPLWSVNIIRTA